MKRRRRRENDDKSGIYHHCCVCGNLHELRVLGRREAQKRISGGYEMTDYLIVIIVICIVMVEVFA